MAQIDFWHRKHIDSLSACSSALAVIFFSVWQLNSSLLWWHHIGCIYYIKIVNWWCQAFRLTLFPFNYTEVNKNSMVLQSKAAWMAFFSTVLYNLGSFIFAIFFYDFFFCWTTFSVSQSNVISHGVEIL